jgi:AcrR family transcriptional regulator
LINQRTVAVKFFLLGPIVRCKTPRQADKILAAAARLFATHRFHEARMEDIAADAAVGKGTLYRYFKDKEELYLALLARAAEGLQARIVARLEGCECPRERLVGFVDALVGYFNDNPYLLDLIQHAEAMQRHDQEFPWQRTRRQNQALVREIFEAGNHAGQFRIDDPDLAALMLLGGLRAVMRFGAKPPADLAERVVAGFLDGYGRPAASGDPARCPPRPSRYGERTPAHAAHSG